MTDSNPPTRSINAASVKEYIVVTVLVANALLSSALDPGSQPRL